MTSFSDRSFGPLRAWIGLSGDSKGRAVVAEPMPGGEGWAVVGHFEPGSDGVLRLMRLEITTEMDLHERGDEFRKAFPSPVPPSVPELGAGLLRAVRLQPLHQRVHGLARHFHRFVEVEKDRSRPGRRGRPDLYYARWAAKYVTELGHANPVGRLAAQEHLSESQIRNILGIARHRQLLTEAPKGRAGGRLTPTAVELLKAELNEDEAAT